MTWARAQLMKNHTRTQIAEASKRQRMNREKKCDEEKFSCKFERITCAQNVCFSSCTRCQYVMWVCVDGCLVVLTRSAHVNISFSHELSQNIATQHDNRVDWNWTTTSTSTLPLTITNEPNSSFQMKCAQFLFYSCHLHMWRQNERISFRLLSETLMKRRN